MRPFCHLALTVAKLFTPHSEAKLKECLRPCWRRKHKTVRCCCLDYTHEAYGGKMGTQEGGGGRGSKGRREGGRTGGRQIPPAVDFPQVLVVSCC